MCAPASSRRTGLGPSWSVRAGGGASDSGWLYRKELVNTATNDRGDTPSGPGTRRRTFSPITGQVIL